MLSILTLLIDTTQCQSSAQIQIFATPIMDGPIFFVKMVYGVFSIVFLFIYIGFLVKQLYFYYFFESLWFKNFIKKYWQKILILLVSFF